MNKFNDEMEMLKSMSPEMKVSILESILREEGYHTFFKYAHKLLEIPVNQGGIPTEVVDNIFSKNAKI